MWRNALLFANQAHSFWNNDIRIGEFDQVGKVGFGEKDKAISNKSQGAFAVGWGKLVEPQSQTLDEPLTWGKPLVGVVLVVGQ
jgi:hypothetical protein